jgi:hypothetical protein
VHRSRVSAEQKCPKRVTAENEKPEWLDFSAEFDFAVGELGLKPDEFWALTLDEFCRMAAGYQRRHTHRLNELLYASWHAEAFARQERLPSLESVLLDAECENQPKREQSAEEMLTVVKMLNAALGGDMKEI